MTLRLRLTLIYATLMGGVLLLLGILVYGLVSATLLNQFDWMLSQAANRLTAELLVDAQNRFDQRSVDNIQFNENILFQVWGADRSLQVARPLNRVAPLDADGLLAGELVLNTVPSGDLQLRVLSVPIRATRGPVGILQVGFDLEVLVLAQRTLATVLIGLSILAMLFAGLATWVVNGRALAPLETMTHAATTITRADDLSRRISQPSSAGREVAELIEAFNQTLERLEQLFTAQERFVADVNHELRTPLTVMKGNISLMRRLKEADEESLDIVDREVDRLTRLVGDLLLLAQADSGRLPLDRQPLQIDTVLLEVYQQMHSLTKERLQFKLLEIDQLLVLADRDRIKQVLLNLVGNAIQYTPPGGEVTLRLRENDGSACLTVSDTGPGIPPEDLPHIFERFYRADKSRTRSEATGFGLGLSIACWIIKNHDGNIEVQSEPGKGTTFKVLLPLVKTPDK
jgi:two-component system, OmpR family, sensor kinase